MEYPLGNADMIGTIMSFLVGFGVWVSNEVDGISLVKILNGEENVKRTLFWHYPHYGNQGGDPSSIIRKGKWKLIHYYEYDENNLAINNKSKTKTSFS